MAGTIPKKTIRKARAKTPGKLPPRIDSNYELAFLNLLEDRKYLGHISDFVVKPCALRLGSDVHYSPDFLVIAADGTVEFHEVKGQTRWAAKSLAKLRAAAAAFPFFRFVLQMGHREKENEKSRIKFRETEVDS